MLRIAYLCEYSTNIHLLYVKPALNSQKTSPKDTVPRFTIDEYDLIAISPSHAARAHPVATGLLSAATVAYSPSFSLLQRVILIERTQNRPRREIFSSFG